MQLEPEARITECVDMHAVTVTFERVFDLHRWEQSQTFPRHTAFGFVADGKPHYAVSVPGWPAIGVGTTITAFLREEENWQSLAGWSNHQTNEKAIPNYKRPFFFAIISGVVSILGWISFFGAGSGVSTQAGTFFAIAYVALLALVAVALGYQGLRLRREAELIKAFSIRPHTLKA